MEQSLGKGLSRGDWLNFQGDQADCQGDQADWCV